MTARAFLVRGLLVGLLAGFATFLVAHQVGEPHVETAIALEEAAAEQAADESGHTHSHEGEGTTVSRPTQRTWGLLTGSLAVGLATGGLVALVAAGVVGRIGRLTPGQSTALVSLVGFVAVALVPFLKYPATPPAVGSADTIGDRTSWFFGFLLVSVALAALSSLLAVRVHEQAGTYAAVLTGAGLYVVAMVVTGALMPTVNEVGDFPADVLWYFRRASLLTLATLWAGIGIGLTGLVGRLHRAEVVRAGRRELAASL
jgi:predicted cobalt transporter CbtA